MINAFLVRYNKDTPEFILAHTHASWGCYYLSDSYSVGRPWLHRVICSKGDFSDGGSGHHQRSI